MKIRLLVSLLLAASSLALASPRQDAKGGVWRDEFPDLTGLSYRQQAAISVYGGITVDAGLQSWSQPQSSTLFSEPFTSPNAYRSGGIVAAYGGTANEFLTLWHNRWDPGLGLQVGSVCDSGLTGDTCPLNPLALNQAQNGLSESDIISGIPGESNQLPGAIWGGYFGPSTSPPAFTLFAISKTLYLNSVQSAGLPLLSGARERSLLPGVDYDVTVLASYNMGSFHALGDYMELRVVNRGSGAVFAARMINENDFLSGSISSSYNASTPISRHLTGLPKAEWDFQVWPAIPGGTHNHCTTLGPIFVTAASGNYRSPVLDTLSPKTRWVSMSWSFDQCTDYLDSGPTAVCTYSAGGCPANNCKCPDTAIAIAPVGMDYSVDDTAPYSGTSVTWGIKHFDWQPAAYQARPARDYTVMFSSTAMVDGAGGTLSGRYLQYTLTMYGRGSATNLDQSLAPGSMHPAAPHVYFGGFKPTVKRIAVNYYACAARLVSTPIAPNSIRKWGKVDFSISLPTPGSSVQVDVLSEDGKVLKAGVNSGVSISDLDPYAYPRLKLRATLTSDPADCSQRPVLESWQADWVPNPELLTLDRNGFRPDRGEIVNAQVRVDRPGRVVVRVYDASGQSIKLLLDGEQLAQATLVVWDGRNERGEKVAPGVYFMSAGVPGAGKVKRVAVLR